jgi:general secretion pathway protein M
MAWQQPLKTRWAALGAREQRGIALAAGVLGAALVWSVALAPALRTLKTAEAQSAQLGATTERMQALQARARLLQAQPATAPQDALKTLQSATNLLGKSASLQVVGEQATLSLKQVSAASLAPWLTPAAGGSPSPAEAHLQRDAGSTEPLWSGILVFRMPAHKPGSP